MANNVPMPPATGSRRISWSEIPRDVTRAIGRHLGSDVVHAVSLEGGFSEGLAARVVLESGGSAFVAAVNSETAPAIARFHRREAQVTSQLQGTASVPRLLATHDDGVWMALVFEDIDGHLPQQPWDRTELSRVLNAATDMSRALTPAPVDARLLAPPRLGGWRDLATGPAVDRLAAVSVWAANHLDDLLALEGDAPLVLGGDTLLHGDLYPFNILLTADRVHVVDWPHAWIGAPHCDVVTILSTCSRSGIDPQPLVAAHPLTRDLAPAAVDVLLAMHAGYLLRTATAVGPHADPNLVAMMVALATGSLDWLRRRLSAG